MSTVRISIWPRTNNLSAMKSKTPGCNDKQVGFVTLWSSRKAEVSGDIYQQGHGIWHNTSALHRVNARLLTAVLPQFVSLSLLPLFASPIPPLFFFFFFFFFSKVDFPELFQSLHSYLRTATGENNASSCLGCIMSFSYSQHMVQPLFSSEW